jgi:hypothetical protein
MFTGRFRSVTAFISEIKSGLQPLVFGNGKSRLRVVLNRVSLYIQSWLDDFAPLVSLDSDVDDGNPKPIQIDQII